MEKADTCRRAASEAVADVEPPRLYDLIESVLERASMVPAVLTLESAAAVAPETTGGTSANVNSSLEESTGDAPAVSADGKTAERRETDDVDGVVSHAAGVQLIYEGLRLTRTLAHDEPWRDDDHDEANVEPDLEILAADILVARGFYLLARTDAAGKAVRTVRAFGRDQTRRDTIVGEGSDQSARATEIDANLERDVLELAVRTGAAAAGETPTPRLLAAADEIADAAGTSFPAAEDCLAGFDRSPSEQSLEDHTTDRATSATDP
ncbi:DUF7114 family protein [Natronobacterium texcoconense]|uniref:Uncharacterized protein n=1 Tax=Natronobacterium texcoconense TaxID=1095778 RepID=A0A1H1HKR7_NATTX|nr:hypothetical protein [Natronobacterium texcoconense]SDR26024.1 hypothetical protein SAMN04489842_2842 [Natronobacterium texcoconense]